jgi:hypothetical protein
MSGDRRRTIAAIEAGMALISLRQGSTLLFKGARLQLCSPAAIQNRPLAYMW